MCDKDEHIKADKRFFLSDFRSVCRLLMELYNEKCEMERFFLVYLHKLNSVKCYIIFINLCYIHVSFKHISDATLFLFLPFNITEKLGSQRCGVNSLDVCVNKHRRERVFLC